MLAPDICLVIQCFMTTKHTDVDFHYIRDKVAQGDLVFQYVPYHLKLVDVFTKVLPSSRFCFLRDIYL